ncbi:MAG TPA: APC family permease [Thermoanaerobaculia bacterium]|jgi:amino acid transporter|nr:APC family permease [Thermoanaerobaculia bacterium]
MPDSSSGLAPRSTGAGLVRAVGFWGLVAMCINAVVGSGVFLLPRETYELLGPFSLWAPVLFAVPVFVLVLCVAAAASHFQEPGGAFLYARTAFGDFVGFETGWMNWLARLTSLAALANGFVVSLARLWPAAAAPGTRAALLIVTIGGLGVVHAVGVRYGAGTIYAFTAGKVIPLVIFIVIALAMMPSNPIPASLTLPGPGTHWSEAALFMLFAYAGFENMGVPAGEYKDPRRDLPLALLVGTLCIAMLYALTQLAAMAVLPDLGTSQTPIADAAGVLLGPWGAVLVTVGALLSMMGTNSGTVLEGSRMLYALSIGRPSYRWISRVHERFRTPLVAIAVHVAIAIPMAIAGSFAKLALLSTVARMTTYLVTCAAVPRLRKRGDGTFRIPLAVAILGITISVLLFATLHWVNLLAAVLAIALGALLYLVGGNRGVEAA